MTALLCQFESAPVGVVCGVVVSILTVTVFEGVSAFAALSVA